MSRQRITVVQSDVRKGTSSKNGKAYEFTVLQCIVTTQKEGEEPHLNVGELMLPRDHPPVTNGEYIAETELGIGMDKRIHGVVTRLVPLRQPPQPKAA